MWVVADRASSALAGRCWQSGRGARDWSVRLIGRRAAQLPLRVDRMWAGPRRRVDYRLSNKVRAPHLPQRPRHFAAGEARFVGGELELVLRFAVDLLLSLVSSCHWGNSGRFWEAEVLLLYLFMWYFLLWLSVWIFAVCFCLCLNYLPSLLLLLCQTLCVNFKNKAMDTDYFKSHVSASRPCPVLSQ